MRVTGPLLAHAEAALATVLRLAGPADEALSRYFRSHRQLGQQDRAFVAESVFAVLRRRRSLEFAAGSPDCRPLLLAALLRGLAFPKRMSWDAWLEDGKGAFPSTRATSSTPRRRRRQPRRWSQAEPTWSSR